ncbi:hypothetical protein C8J56DRAFT_886271 [Mycena floridula]|nr:hypothetical protein C8J56DRAFT_886271 [Mycena floridula]
MDHQKTQLYSADWSLIRNLVIMISLLEVVQWIVATMDAWCYLVTIWADFSGFFRIPWEAPHLWLYKAFMHGMPGTKSQYQLKETHISPRQIWIMADDWLILGGVAILVEAVKTSLPESLNIPDLRNSLQDDLGYARLSRHYCCISLTRTQTWLIGSLVHLCIDASDAVKTGQVNYLLGDIWPKRSLTPAGSPAKVNSRYPTGDASIVVKQIHRSLSASSQLGAVSDGLF